MTDKPRISTKFWLAIREAQNAMERWARADLTAQLENWINGDNAAFVPATKELADLFNATRTAFDAIEPDDEPLSNKERAIINGLLGDVAKSMQQVAFEGAAREDPTESANAQFAAMALARQFMFQLTLFARMLAAKEEQDIKAGFEKRDMAEKRTAGGATLH